MGYMKTEFEKWLSSLVKKDGSHYSKETQSNYITALKSYPGKMTGLNLDVSDLFHIDDLDNYDRIYQIIQGVQNLNLSTKGTIVYFPVH